MVWLGGMGLGGVFLEAGLTTGSLYHFQPRGDWLACTLTP
ncbi:hypothetical protein VCHA54P486_370009 [Vibrio chagasii]|nr:hypothetical protein VCHA54P486_370009 [Vibrio chagasii]